MKSDSFWKSVYKAASFVLAVAIEESLNKAGYMTVIRGDDKGMKHVLVHRTEYRNALQLLATDPKYGEIFTDTTYQK